MNKKEIKFRDPVVERVVDKFVDRSDVGFEKYKITLDKDPSDMFIWMNHLQEELMDAVNYIQKLKMETSDALEEKILKDYEEEDSFSKHKSPEGWVEDRTW